MNIVVFDDEQSTLDYLESLILNHYGSRHSVFTFSESKDLQNYSGEADVLLADIKLQESNGIEQAILFTQKYPHTKVIFITGYPSEYFEDIFSGIRPYAFLGKPIHEDRLFGHLDYLDNRTQEESYSFTHKGKQYSILFSEILFIESHGRQKTIHTLNQLFVVNSSFDTMLDALPGYFSRCHSAFIVNMQHIIAHSSTNLLMKDNHMIPIGRKYKIDFRNQFTLFKTEDF